MRHGKNNRKLNRNKPEREALLRNLVRALFISQSIKTTIVKAKEARRLAEKLITLGKKNDLCSRRKVFSVLRDKTLNAKLFKEITPLFKNRNSGYTRIVRFGARKGDNAQLVVLELTEKKVVLAKGKLAKGKTEETKVAQETEPKSPLPSTAEKPKELPHEKHAHHRKEMQFVSKTPGFMGTLRKFFKGRTK